MTEFLITPKRLEDMEVSEYSAGGPVLTPELLKETYEELMKNSRTFHKFEPVYPQWVLDKLEEMSKDD